MSPLQRSMPASDSSRWDLKRDTTAITERMPSFWKLPCLFERSPRKIPRVLKEEGATREKGLGGRRGRRPRDISARRESRLTISFPPLGGGVFSIPLWSRAHRGSGRGQEPMPGYVALEGQNRLSPLSCIKTPGVYEALRMTWVTWMLCGC